MSAMWPTVIGVALAQPIEDSQVEAVVLASSVSALSRIPGCHDLAGTYEVRASLGGRETLDEAWLVRGTLREGSWEDREVARSGSPEEWIPDRSNAASAFGTDPLVKVDVGWRALLADTLPGAVSSQYVKRMGDTWAVVSTLDGGRRSTNTMVTLLAHGTLDLRGLQVRVDSPIRRVDNAGTRIRIEALTMDLVVDENSVPVSETFDVRFRQGLMVGTSRQRTVWTARPCAG